MFKSVLEKYKTTVINNNKGFTLLETIISIAIISFISVFILQMFIVSSSANEKARGIDVASTEAISTIETIKSADSIIDIESNDAFQNAIRITDVENNLYYKWFDKDWNVIKPSSENTVEVIDFTKPELEIDFNKIPVGAAYVMVISYDNFGEGTKSVVEFTSSDSQISTEEKGGMIDITIKVYDLDALNNKSELVNFNAKKYFYK